MVACWPLLVVTRGALSRSTPLLLVEGADHELELGIGEHAGHREDARGCYCARTAEEQSVDGIGADAVGAGTVTRRHRCDHQSRCLRWRTESLSC